jgi:hypothetical protein
MQRHLGKDEKELLELTKTVVGKLTAMSDEEFESIADELIADFE